MSATHRTPAALTGLLLALITLLLTAPTAFAHVPLPDPAAAIPPSPTPPAPVVSVVSNGSPIWLFLLVAAAAVVLTIAATLTAQKLYHARDPRVAHA
jgi:hypothetical protein